MRSHSPCTSIAVMVSWRCTTMSRPASSFREPGSRFAATLRLHTFASSRGRHRALRNEPSGRRPAWWSGRRDFAPLTDTLTLPARLSDSPARPSERATLSQVRFGSGMDLGWTCCAPGGSAVFPFYRRGISARGKGEEDA